MESRREEKGRSNPGETGEPTGTRFAYKRKVGEGRRRGGSRRKKIVGSSTIEETSKRD